LICPFARANMTFILKKGTPMKRPSLASNVVSIRDERVQRIKAAHEIPDTRLGKYAVPFAEFWEIYPRRIGKGSARRAFIKACGLEAPEIIITAAREFKHASSRTERRYIPYPATWLNAERWEDDLESTYDQTTTDRLNEIVSAEDSILSIEDL
jgi:hypothetical protein